jgi:hypothetical protein
MNTAGFESAAPVSERSQTHALDRTFTTTANDNISNNTTTITANTNTNITVFKAKQAISGKNRNYNNIWADTAVRAV